MEKFANAVKALIVYKSKLLVLRNALDDPNRPGQVDFPGGRLEPGENPYIGLEREVGEELGTYFADNLFIDYPIDVHHFERADGQVITMMFFGAFITKDLPIKISPEHSSFEWVDLDKAEELFDKRKEASTYAMWRAFNRLKDLEQLKPVV